MLVEGSSRFSWSFWLLNQASLSANAVSITLLEDQDVGAIHLQKERTLLLSYKN